MLYHDFVSRIKFCSQNADSLEFSLQKDGKRFLKLADTKLKFAVELPANYIPDNQFGHKMFECLELSANHEQISRKSTALDYSVSEYFFQKVSYDDSYVLSSMDISGTYDNGAYDVSDATRLATRLSYGENFTKTVTHKEETYRVPWRRWYLIMNLNHGLARTPDCLPANIAVNFRFQRASAECCYLKISENLDVVKISDNSKHSLPVNYTETVVPIINPRLSAYYAYSPELESSLSRVTSRNLEISFLGFNVIKKGIFCIIIFQIITFDDKFWTQV